MNCPSNFPRHQVSVPGCRAWMHVPNLFNVISNQQMSASSLTDWLWAWAALDQACQKEPNSFSAVASQLIYTRVEMIKSAYALLAKENAEINDVLFPESVANFDAVLPRSTDTLLDIRNKLIASPLTSLNRTDHQIIELTVQLNLFFHRPDVKSLYFPTRQQLNLTEEEEHLACIICDRK